MATAIVMFQNLTENQGDKNKVKTSFLQIYSQNIILPQKLITDNNNIHLFLYKNQQLYY